MTLGTGIGTSHEDAVSRLVRSCSYAIHSYNPAQIIYFCSDHSLTILQLYGSLFFAAAKTLEEMLPSTGTTRSAVVILRLRGHLEMGSTFVTVLRKYVQELKNHDSTLMLVGVNEEIYNQLKKTGTLNIIGEKNIYPATRRIGESLTQATAAAIDFLKEKSGA